jgi:hypothetical protein
MNQSNQTAAVAVLASVMWMPVTADSTATAILAAIVEADRAAMEANDLVGLGVIPHDRYQRLAQARDEAIDRAAEFLGR